MTHFSFMVNLLKFCAKAAELILETDRQMKTSYDEPERLLEVLIMRLAQEARHD